MKKSIEEFDKIFELLKSYDHRSDDYIYALMTQAKMYQTFELLDKAEFYVLKACGLSDSMAKEISETVEIKSKEKANRLIAKIESKLKEDNYYGFHVARSFVQQIAHIKSDKKYDKLREEAKQGKYDMLLIPTLYRYRNAKLNRTYRLKKLQEKLKTAKGSEAKLLEDTIATLYVYLGRFDEASNIADKFLAKDKNDINSLYTKMNIAMSSGKYDEMKEYEARIEKIQPNAFKK